MKELVEKFKAWTRQIGVGDELSRKDIIGLRKLADDMEAAMVEKKAEPPKKEEKEEEEEEKGFWD